jgi:hypothetical protein
MGSLEDLDLEELSRHAAAKFGKPIECVLLEIEQIIREAQRKY